MIVFPNAKINIGLNIIQRRQDGYHNIETAMVPIKLSDVLEIIPSKHPSFQTTGIPIPDDGQNLVLQAYELLKNDTKIPEVAIHLHKIIPMGAGLGGGSSDAAFALKALNELFELGLETQQLENYARKIGSDCAFFIKNEPVIAKGRGDELEPLSIHNIQGKYLILVCPNVHSNTAEAYSGVISCQPKKNLKKTLSGEVGKWKNEVFNQFETTIFKKHPELHRIKQSLYESGAVYASMSGSGSAVYGIFDNEPDTRSIEEYGKCVVERFN